MTILGVLGFDSYTLATYGAFMEKNCNNIFILLQIEIGFLVGKLTSSITFELFSAEFLLLVRWWRLVDSDAFVSINVQTIQLIHSRLEMDLTT